jgi:hypothetical protein
VLDNVSLLQAIETGAGVVFLLLMVRIFLLLGATPVGAMQREILYVRAAMFRPLLRLTVVFLVLEGVQFVLPLVGPLVGLPEPWTPRVDALIDVAQAALLVVIGAGVLRVFSPYSRRSLEDLEVFARRSVEAVARRVGRARPAREGRRRA